MNYLGFREVKLNNSSLINWRTVTIDIGAAHSTLQDIKVPEYGGGYHYKLFSTANLNGNRYIFWRVYHHVVEFWEESLDEDFENNYVQLRFTDSPVLEGLTVTETSQYIVILLATVSSVHQFRLPHPQVLKNSKGYQGSVFSDLTYQTLKKYHNLHILNTSGESLPHTAATYLLNGEGSCRDAVFILAQTSSSLKVVKMSSLPYSVHVQNVKLSSLMNRLITGFVPSIFRSIEGGENIASMLLEEIGSKLYGLGVCYDGRLRLWSYPNMECVLNLDSLENTAEGNTRLTPSAQRHLIRSCKTQSCHFVGIFLSFVEKQLIILYEPTIVLGQVTFNHLKTLYPPHGDIVDFVVLQEYVWSLWTDANNEIHLLYASVNNDCKGSPGLKEALLEQHPSRDILFSDSSFDAKEVYLAELFTPRRFSVHTIAKALSIYRRNVDFTGLASTELDFLVNEVEQALQEEVDSRMVDELDDEAAAQIVFDAWSTFYSHTLQYHHVGQKAFGLVAVGNSLVGIIRKQDLSWMRPVDVIEQLTLGPLSAVSFPALVSTPLLSEDTTVGAAVVSLAVPLRTIHKALDSDIVGAFSLDMYHHQIPDQIALSIISSLLMSTQCELECAGDTLSSIISQQISAVPGIAGAIKAYLRAIQLDLGSPDALALDSSTNACVPEWLAGVLNGKLGAALISESVFQLAQSRYELCRDLLLLQHTVLQLAESCQILPHSMAIIKSTLIPQTSLLTQAYFALMKVCNAPVVMEPPHVISVTQRQLATLSLPDNFSQNSYSCLTVLEVFFQGIGGRYARSLLANSHDISTSLSSILLPLATTVAQLAWPISRCLLLVEFLVWGCHYNAAQEYIRLLQPWCEWNSCSRLFLLAISFLNQANARKALQLFMKAVEGISTEEYLYDRIASNQPDSSAGEATLQYFLKVLRLLDQSGHPLLSLEMANAGLMYTSSSEQDLSALYSVIFKHHLELHHHDEAFTALQACPDQQRKRNHLRQLVITLYERKELQTLINYQYDNLESEVIAIIENRARSSDILLTNYYNLLYSFHVKKYNYKKAACVMYECGLRLNVEGVGEKGLQQLAKCYLACINCLKHIPEDHAWIVKPTATDTAPFEDRLMEDSPVSCVASKRSLDGIMHFPLKEIQCKQQVKVLELRDIEREYQLVHARLKIMRILPDGRSTSVGGPLSPVDTVSLLVHGRLFRDAVSLSYLFELPLHPVFCSLALTCCEADNSREGHSSWAWMAENGIQKEDQERGSWWHLLRFMLEEEEQGKQSSLHSSVAKTLLEQKTRLPAWLVESYKLRNAGELLRLYVDFGYLQDAVILASEYIDAVLGYGTKAFGLPNALHSSAPPVLMPYYALDRLYLHLKETENISHYAKIFAELKAKMSKYEVELQRVSKDKVLLCS